MPIEVPVTAVWALCVPVTLRVWGGYFLPSAVLCGAAKEANNMAKKRANGEGNIRKRSDGRWEGRYTAGYHPDTGKRIIKNVLGRTQAEVRAKLKKAIEEAGSLDVVKAGKYMVAEWLRLWFEVYAKPNLRFSTAEYYRRGMSCTPSPTSGRSSSTN